MSQKSKQKRDRRKKEQESEVRRMTHEKQALEASTRGVRGLRIKRSEYADSWSQGNAAKFEQDGHYAWMAGFLDGYERIIEIGTGDGRGTMELARRGHIVISIDENPTCLHLARERLSTAGIPVLYQDREVSETIGDNYVIRYPRHPGDWPSNGVLLVEGDLLNDPQLLDWATTHKADAVVCWLMGTHKARHKNEGLKHYGIPDSGGYRLAVENMTYKFADIVLRPGGILHFVRRGEGTTSELLYKDLLYGVREQAAETSLVVDESFPERPYEESTAGVDMGMKPGTSGRVPTDYKPTLTSIIVRKPGK